MAEYQGVDALLAAITDEPLPEGAQDDAEFMAEHRAAVADMALLRERLKGIGDALADRTEATEPEPKPVPVRAPRKRTRRPLVLALGTLAATAVAAMVVGMGWLIMQAGSGVSSISDDSGSAEKAAGGDSSLSAPGYLACSRLVVEGTVAQVEQVPGGALDRITLDVSRYYKPDQGKDEITFVMNKDVDPRLHEGDHVLVGIPLNSGSPDIWTTGEKEIAQERAWILDALPDSRDITC
ncbi:MULTISPECIES: hypothetical protein [unclassified Streptomyces]|uniref:hypothetical protein n=1 Tax=unclassified Streptomyces TaxID=2593676 RepID=UPI002DD7DE24|nr:hypothetical protein [Streptomyces sp. NBC_00243]WRZ22497.1 hypothetical protein OHT59_30465 [Streptomyces sp. NBC_00243]